MTQISAKFFASLVSDTEAVQDDWTQRLKENPHDPLEEIRQEHEEFLTQLEGLAVEAIATNNWDAFYSHVVNFQNENDLHGESLIAIGIEDANADDLSSPGAGSLPTNELTND